LLDLNNEYYDYALSGLGEAFPNRENLKIYKILTLLASFMSVSQWKHIYYLWRPNLKDEADNHLIELAIAGNARILATKNIKDFQNAELLFPELSILKPEEIIRSDSWQP